MSGETDLYPVRIEVTEEEAYGNKTICLEIVSINISGEKYRLHIDVHSDIFNELTTIINALITKRALAFLEKKLSR